MRKSIPLILLFVLLGCRTRLNDETTVTVDSAEQKYRIIEAITSPQTVKVHAKPDNGQINVYFFLEKDRDEVEKEIERGKQSPKLLAHKLKTAEADLQATVPAKESAMVLIQTADTKKHDVKVKITN